MLQLSGSQLPESPKPAANATLSLRDRLVSGMSSKVTDYILHNIHVAISNATIYYEAENTRFYTSIKYMSWLSSSSDYPSNEVSNAVIKLLKVQNLEIYSSNSSGIVMNASSQNEEVLNILQPTDAEVHFGQHSDETNGVEFHKKAYDIQYTSNAFNILFSMDQYRQISKIFDNWKVYNIGLMYDHFIHVQSSVNTKKTFIFIVGIKVSDGLTSTVQRVQSPYLGGDMP